MNDSSDWVKLYLGKKDGAHVLGCTLKLEFTYFSTYYLMPFLDSEFTQLMKGLQGERLRQAFKYLDDNQDGFIRPEQFKRIILVRFFFFAFVYEINLYLILDYTCLGTCGTQVI